MHKTYLVACNNDFTIVFSVYGASTNQSEPHLEGNNSCSSGIGVNSITYPNVSLLGGEPGNVDNDGSKHVGPKTLLGPASFSTNAAKNEAPLLSRRYDIFCKQICHH